jgi:uncharacterized protein YdiU (UPF0061 family)
MVIYSQEMARDLGFTESEVMSEGFVKYFSGDVDGAFVAEHNKDDSHPPIETWATPYALSIMGRRLTSNCPYGTGDGYGDGRAISVGEIVVPVDTSAATTAPTSTSDLDGDGYEVQPNADAPAALYPHGANRFELQLKGAGQTPFCRGADGRAVLRSSIREFLASEAMYHLGVCTTRALSLIVSDGPDGDTSTRPWYSDNANSRVPNIPKMDDPRLAKYSEKERKEILSQLAVQAKADPDTLVEERCAITTRVASSFIRVGHLDLFARRVEMWQMKAAKAIDDATAKGEKGKEGKTKSKQLPSVKESQPYQELEELLWHACYREYYNDAYLPHWEAKDAKGAALALLDAAMVRISNTVAGWVRVGFVQGNFNADNCLIGGRTMDYGPFGFLDVYHPLSAKWTGSGEHFGFMNQPSAGYANFAVLVESLLPVIDAHGGNVDDVRDEMLKKASSVFSDALDRIMREKMGLELGPPGMTEEADDLWGEIEPLLRTARADWTLFWRQLTYVAEKYAPAYYSTDYNEMLDTLLGDESAVNPFYETLSDDNRDSLLSWIEKWHKAIARSHSFALENSSENLTPPPPSERMKLANPKYTLREWMLVEAYSKADAGKFIPGDYSIVHELFNLSKDPYSEGSPEFQKKYYRRAPDSTLRAGGTAFMS